MIQLPGASPAAAMSFVDTPRRSAFAIVRRRFALFATIVVGFITLVAVATLMSPKSYTTHVKFIAGNVASPNGQAQGQTLLPVLNAIIEASNAQSSETYAEMLRQTPAVQKTIDELNLRMSPADLLGHVKVKPVPNTSILDVGVTWTDREMSAKIANALADAFIEVRRDLVSAQAASAIDYIGGQLPGAQAASQRSAAALAAYQSRNGIADAGQQTQSALAALAGIDQKYAAVQIDRQQASAQLSVVNQQLARTSQTMSGGQQIAPNPVVAQLRSQLATVDVQLKSALQQYTEQHPTVIGLRAQEAELKRELAATPATVVAQNNTVANPVHQALQQQAATLGAQLASDDAQLRVLRQQRAQAEPAIRRLPVRAAELAVLQHQAKLDEDVYNALQQKYNEARIARTTTLSDVSVIARAAANDASVRPNLLLNLFVATLIALFLGFAGVLVVERVDRTVKTEEDVSERLALPVLTSVPTLPATGEAPRWLQAALVDSFLQLVTSLRYASSERLRTIAFTSSGPQDGKSLIALDTAIALAEIQPRVLIVDADLRLPSLHAKLGQPREPGLSDVLVGTASFEEAIRPTRHDGLDLVTGGTRAPNAYALLQSPAFERFLEEARGRYEAVVLDTPACGAVVDAALVCARADGTVYVVASHETDGDQAERGLARLRSAGVRNLVGAVLNKVAPRRSNIGPYGETSDGARAFPLPPPRGTGVA